MMAHLRRMGANDVGCDIEVQVLTTKEARVHRHAVEVRAVFGPLDEEDSSDDEEDSSEDED